MDELLSIACGSTSIRQLGKFCFTSQSFFKAYFKLQRVPSHVNFHTVLGSLDSAAFVKQCSEHYLPTVQGEDFIAADGQALGATVTNSQNSSQVFCSVVSLYCQQSGLTVALQSYLNQKS